MRLACTRKKFKQPLNSAKEDSANKTISVMKLMRSFIKCALFALISVNTGCGNTQKEAPVFDLEQQGFILDWVLMGPFPSEEISTPEEFGAVRSGYNKDFLTGLGGERQAVLYDGVETTITKKNGEKRTVKAKLMGPDLEDPDRPDFKRVINDMHIHDRDYDEAVAYAFCYLYADRPQKLFAHMAVDGSPKVWLNDSLVYANWEDLSKSKDWHYNFDIHVKKGKNRFLIKIDNTEQWFGFRIELYNEEQNKLRIKEKVNSVGFTSVTSGKDEVEVLAHTVPQIEDYQLSATLKLLTLDGKILAKKDILTGSRESISPVNIFYNGPVSVEVAPTINPENSKKELSWIGDYNQSISALYNKYNEAKVQYASFIPSRMQKIYTYVFQYYDRFLSQEEHVPDQNFILNYQFVERLTDALNQGKDLLSHIPDEAVPVLYRVKGYGGMNLEIPAHISIPENYGTSAKEYPLVIELHGSGGFGKDKPHWPKANSRIEMEGEPIIILKPGAPKLSFHLQRNYWDPVYLDNVLAETKNIFDINEERIYLNGASGGGKGTWNWINHSPEHFAASIILVGTEGYPFRAEKIRYLPLWVINGDLDRASYPFLPEVTVNRLRDIGSNVIFTNFAGLRHSVSSGYDKQDLKKWLLAHRNPHKVGGDPLFNMSIKDEGYSNVILKKIPAKTYLGLTEKENPRYPQDNVYRSAMKLYQAYRKPNSAMTEREAQGYTLIYEPDFSSEEGKEILLDAPISEPGENGDLRRKDIKELNVASVYIKCKNDYDDFNKIREKAFANLIKEGYQVTNEAINYMLTISDAKDRYWEACFVLED